jgi:cysteinyl-tRNA synthetase
MDQKDLDTKNIISVLEQWNRVFAFIFIQEKGQIEDYIIDAANKRFIARGQKDYQTADAMRKLIEKAGYIVEDRKDKCSIKKKES